MFAKSVVIAELGRLLCEFLPSLILSRLEREEYPYPELLKFLCLTHSKEGRESPDDINF